ncbi:MAG TPA: J domain-containing protein, partial [Kofleriaceae bacterium]
GRVALSAGLVTSTHVARSLEAMAKDPGRDPVDILTELARLSAEQVTRLKRRLVAQRASRIFALPAARYTLDNARSLRADPDVPAVDARWLINFSLRTHYTIERLDAELAQVADRPLTLAADAASVLPAFGFADGDRPLLDRLRQRAWTLHQLSEASPEIEARLVRAVVYALIACDCLEEGAMVGQPAPRPSPSSSAPPPRPSPTSSAPPPRHAPSSSVPPPRPSPSSSAPPPRSSTSSAPPPRSSTSSAAPPATGNPRSGTRPGLPPPPQAAAPRPTLAQGTDRSLDFRTPGGRTRPESALMLRRAKVTTVPPGAAGSAASETRSLIAEKLRTLDAGGDHFSILGVPKSASVDDVRTAYFSLAKRLHPDRLQAVGLDDSSGDAQRLFARINLAFGILSDPLRRTEYARMLSEGGEEAVKKAQDDADVIAGRILKAEETFHRGEMALRRSQFDAAKALFEEAVELNSDEAEYQALLAWATWLCAPDKIQVSAAVQKRLGDAVALSPLCAPAHFYRGQVSKHIGRTQAAIEAFKQVLEIQPEHSEAKLELRVLLGRERKDDSKRFLEKLKKPPK